MIRQAQSFGFGGQSKGHALLLEFDDDDTPATTYQRVDGDTCLKDCTKVDPEFVSRFNDTDKTVLQETDKEGRMLREIRDVCAVRQVTMEKRYFWDRDFLMQVQFYIHNHTNKSVTVKFDPECTNGNVEFFRADASKQDASYLTLTAVPCEPHTKDSPQSFTIDAQRKNALCLVSERKQRDGDPNSMGFRFDYNVKKSWF